MVSTKKQTEQHMNSDEERKRGATTFCRRVVAFLTVVQFAGNRRNNYLLWITSNSSTVIRTSALLQIQTNHCFMLCPTAVPLYHRDQNERLPVSSYSDACSLMCLYEYEEWEAGQRVLFRCHPASNYTPDNSYYD